MLDKIKAKLIVSCQALPEEPLHSSFIMGRMAIAAKEGGAGGIRAQGGDDINEIKRVCDLPIIGIIKRNYEDCDIYITATQKEVNELLSTSCEMIAMDATNRIRPNGENIADLLAMVQTAGREAMADISTYEEAIAAQELGFDCVSTTLCGYTPYSKKMDGPDYDLIQRLIDDLSIPVIAEGRIHYPEQLSKVFEFGVHSAVVGGAITRPKEITERFIEVLNHKIK